MAVVEYGERLGVAPPDEGDQLLVREELVLSSSISHTPFYEISVVPDHRHPTPIRETLVPTLSGTLGGIASRLQNYCNKVSCDLGDSVEALQVVVSDKPKKSK